MLAISKFDNLTWEAIEERIKSSSPVMPVKRNVLVDQSAPIIAITDPLKVPTMAAPVLRLKPCTKYSTNAVMESTTPPIT